MTRRTIDRRTTFCLLALGSFAVSWSLHAHAEPPPEEGVGEAAAPACCEIWGERHDPETVRLEFARHGKTGWESAVVYGDGVAVIDGRRQRRVEPAVVADLLRLVEKGGFRDMESMYGAGMKRVRARVTLDLGDYHQESARLLHGVDPEPLTGLVDRLHKRMAREAGEATGAASLEEALRSIADGSLSHRTLQVTVLHRTETAEAAEDRVGWIVRVHDGWIEAERLVKGPDRPRPVRRHETRETVAALAEALVAAEAWSLPGNLYASDYTQVTVEVLRHRHTVLARPFARRDPEDQGAERQRLNRLLAHLQPLESDLHAGFPQTNPQT